MSNTAHQTRLREWRETHDYPWQKALHDKRKVKGMMFLGCSFTWGQGLWYYSNLDSLREPPPDCYDEPLVATSHVRFMESVRYPRIVAKYFNTYELVQPFNGGSNESIIQFSKNKIFNGSHEGSYKSCEYNDISHVVFQMTQYQRKHVFINHKGHTLEIHNGNQNDPTISEIFIDYLIENNMTIEDFQKYVIELNVLDVKTYLQHLENQGIKTYLITWPDYYTTHIKLDSWLNERHIPLTYNNYSYDSIESLMNSVSFMQIKHDYDEFIDTPKDHHPSLKCHVVLAENVIRRIENE